MAMETIIFHTKRTFRAIPFDSYMKYNLYVEHQQTHFRSVFGLVSNLQRSNQQLIVFRK